MYPVDPPGKQYQDLEDPSQPLAQKPYLVDCSPDIRSGFVRRVYALMCIQMMLTGAVVGVVVCEPSVREGVQAYPETFYVSLILSLFTMCPLVAYKDRHPLNLALLFLFTLFQAYVVAYICAAYASAGLGLVVVSALATTTVLFATLSLYVHISGHDLSWLGGLVFAGLGALFLFGIVGLFFPTFMMQSLIAGFGVVTFSGLVLYDTSLMLHHLTADDAVVAAVQLYLDFVNLFLYILQCMTLSSDSS